MRSVDVTVASLNAGDVFLLDDGDTIIQWNGKEANHREKAKGLEVSRALREEHGGRATFSVIDQGSETDRFWAALGGQGPIAPADADDAPENDHSLAAGTAKLVRVSDAAGGGELSTTVVATGQLAREMLDTNDVFLLDNQAEVFVWIGKAASEAERRGGMERGDSYVREQGRPAFTRLTKVMQGAETATFKVRVQPSRPSNTLCPLLSPGVSLSAPTETCASTAALLPQGQLRLVDRRGRGQDATSGGACQWPRRDRPQEAALVERARGVDAEQGLVRQRAGDARAQCAAEPRA